MKVRALFLFFSKKTLPKNPAMMIIPAMRKTKATSIGVPHRVVWRKCLNENLPPRAVFFGTA